MAETNPKLAEAARPLPLGSASAHAARLRSVLKRDVREWAPGLALALLWIGFSLADARFADPTNISTLASQAAVPLILATGLTFIVVQGSIDLSIEGVMAVCSLCFALLVRNSRSGFDIGYVAIAASMLLGAGIGAVNGLLVVGLRVPSFMVTLGMWSITSGVAMLISGGAPPQIKDMGLRTWSLGDSFGVPHLIIVAGAFLGVGYILQTYTRFGRYSYVIGGSEEIARLSGIAVDRFKVLAFAFGALSAGLAAALESARLGLGHVEIGADQMFLTITAVVIGGTSLIGGSGGVLHSAIGVLILTVLSNGMIYVGVTPYLQTAVRGVIILVAVIGATWRLRKRLRVIK
jgi:ribose transport system permease protein